MDDPNGVSERDQVIADSRAFCQGCRDTPIPSHFGSPRICGWDASGAFTEANWNCVTLNALRSLAGEEGDSEQRWGWTRRYDDQSIAVVVVPDTVEEVGGFIILTFYKRRGRTSWACVVGDHPGSEPLTLAAAESVVRALRSEIPLPWDTPS